MHHQRGKGQHEWERNEWLRSPHAQRYPSCSPSSALELLSNRNRVARLVVQKNCRKIIAIHQPGNLDTSTKLKQLHKTQVLKLHITNAGTETSRIHLKPQNSTSNKKIKFRISFSSSKIHDHRLAPSRNRLRATRKNRQINNTDTLSGKP